MSYILSRLTLQQSELLENLEAVPEYATDYVSVQAHAIGQADPQIAIAALDEVGIRHASYRTNLVVHRGKVVQRVGREGPVTTRALVDSVDEVGTIIRSEMDARINLAALVGGSPLTRWTLAEHPGGISLIRSIHHAVTDQWSDALFWRDFDHAYRALIDGERPFRYWTVPRTPSDIDLQQRESTAALLPVVTERWKEILAGYRGGPFANLPAETDLRQQESRGVVPKRLGARVEAFARKLHVSVGFVLTCSIALAVARIGSGDDGVFASDLSNREDPTRRDTVGFLVNTTMLRVQVDTSDDLAALCKRMRGAWLDVLEDTAVYMECVRQAVGGPTAVKVNLVQLPKKHQATPLFNGHEIVRLNAAKQREHWRPFGAFWVVGPTGYRLHTFHRPSLLGPEYGADIVRLALESLRRLAG